MIPEFKIHKPKKTHLPDLSHRLINQNESKILEAFQYINYPIIQDGFSNHIARREFLKEIHGTAAWNLIQQNKLRKNNILKVLRLIAHSNYFFRDANLMISSQALTLLEYFKQYEDMSLEAKKKLTKTIDKLILKFHE